MFSDFINFNYFISAFSIGILLTYIYNPPRKIIIRFPNPNNFNKLVYQDNNENCYKYNASVQKCSDIKDKQMIIPQPILEDFNNKIRSDLHLSKYI